MIIGRAPAPFPTHTSVFTAMEGILNVVKSPDASQMQISVIGLLALGIDVDRFHDIFGREPSTDDAIQRYSQRFAHTAQRILEPWLLRTARKQKDRLIRKHFLPLFDECTAHQLISEATSQAALDMLSPFFTTGE